MPEHRLTIAANGRVRASVAGREIEVLGRFDGQAEADGSLRLVRGGEVFGDIYARSIVIEKARSSKGTGSFHQSRKRESFYSIA